MLFERIKLEKDEKMLRVVRAHWWIIFTQLFSIAIVALLPLVALLVWPLITEATGTTTFLRVQSSVFWIGYLFWLLASLAVAMNTLTNYYLDLWAITDRRIVSIDQQGFFRRRLSSFRLERLQDMNITVTGIIPTLLNYGTIEAQTAGGSNEEFMTHNMPDPRGLKALIIHAADVRQREAGVQQQLNTEGL
jgi:uncharacterized membrane protein YdbT with pleckstrin-like domain